MADFVSIDFETANHHRCSICSIGLVCVENNKITDRFYSLIRPYPNFYLRRNSEIHGLTSSDTEISPTFEEIWPLVYAYLGKNPLFAHNSPFDKSCLEATLKYYQFPIPDFHFYCTYRLSRKFYPQLENHQLHTVARFCGYDLKQHHHALADAEACACIVLYMLKEQQTDSLQELMRFAMKR